MSGLRGPSRGYRPISPEQLLCAIADVIGTRAVGGTVTRLLLDGPPCAEALPLAEHLAEVLRGRGRPAVVLCSDGFWRDASVRLEFGHEDTLSLRTWLDAGALNREVLDPLAAGGSGRYLPSLRDPITNRATRARPRLAAPDSVLIVTGQLLLDQGLHHDVAIHLAVSPGARARSTPAELAWTLPALAEYDEQVRPAEIADVSIRYDDPRHPAVHW